MTTKISRYRELKILVDKARELVKIQDNAIKNNLDTIEIDAIEFVRFVAEKKLRKRKGVENDN